jgi:Ser/Thr protein kinase RdoA (MazF antagonist)
MLCNRYIVDKNLTKLKLHTCFQILCAKNNSVYKFHTQDRRPQVLEISKMEIQQLYPKVLKMSL